MPEHSTANRVKNINYISKLLSEKLAINDRIEKMKETEAHTTVKDYKEGCPTKSSFRLIKPSKSDIGKISKTLLDKINKILILNTSINQWKNTATVSDWFKNVANKKLCSFIQLDVENIYPSISLNLFNEAI